MPERALIKMKDDTEHVRSAHPYEDFWSKVTALPGPYTNIACIYCSITLERVIRKRWADNNTAEDHRVPLKGLGDLPLERAAALHARFGGLETPHVRQDAQPNESTDPYSSG